MSQAATAATTRVIEIEPAVTALHEPETGSLEFRKLDSKGDFILATSNWNADRNMTDKQVKAYFDRHKESIEADFSEALRMR